MDIFVIKTNSVDNLDIDLLKEFQKKEITDTNTLKTHCFSYLMLDRILKNHYNINNQEIIFYGKKPFLKSREMFFSISHSGEYIVLAFSTHDCGVDIEQIKLREFGAISKRMGFQCNTLEEFYVEWTRYEAEYKLGKPAQKKKKFHFDNYIITATSVNVSEEFDIFIQT